MTGIFQLLMNNKLYCTFTTLDAYEEVANTIQTSYVILFNKLFVLESLDGEKIMITYNVDMNNSARDSMVDNTILVHRKKQTNTLYTIKKKDHPKIHSQKLFNYYIQATETETNIRKIQVIQDYLKDKKTKLVLYIYDAFIFDVSKLDGKQTLIDLENILSDKFPIKLKIGKHYGALQ